MPSPNHEFTPEDIAFAAMVIRDTYDEVTGRHPEPIFHAFNATAVRYAVELVVTIPGTNKVLLTRRANDDPYYAGTWHLPGVIVTIPDIDRGPHPDATVNAAVRAKDELEDTPLTSLVSLSPQWLRQQARKSKRGGEMAAFYGAYLLDEKPRVGEMFDSDDLPEPIHEHHPQIIAAGPRAVHLAMTGGFF